MIIEIEVDLKEVDFTTKTKKILSISPFTVIDTSRDYSYSLNINSIGEGIFELTIYIIHQEQKTGEISVSYVGVIKTFLLDVGDIEQDRKDLIDFVNVYVRKAWKYVCEKEPNLKIDLRNELKTAEFCDKIIASMKKVGFYKL